jgi:GNAT superfamily N-acetyltransferase
MTLPVAERLSSRIRVRLLEPEDSLAHLTGLLHRAYKVHVESGLHALAGFQPEEVTRRRIAGGECYVATYLGKVVGTILFKNAAATASAWPTVEWVRACATPAPGPGAPAGGDDGRPARTGGCASFSQFAVEPAFQGKGIGTVLMETAERRAAATGAAELALSTPEPAAWLVQMYQRHGYRTVQRHHWPETNYVSAIMSKSIGPPA